MRMLAAALAVAAGTISTATALPPGDATRAAHVTSNAWHVRRLIGIVPGRGMPGYSGGVLHQVAGATYADPFLSNTLPRQIGC
jgi:hypothetical protein